MRLRSTIIASERDGEHGAATVLALALGSLLMLLGLAASFVAAVAVAHRTAQAAADLAALAAAQAAQHGTDPCGRASEIAAANGARLRSCRVVGEQVWIEVVAPAPSWAGYTPTARGRARTGPADHRPGTSPGMPAEWRSIRSEPATQRGPGWRSGADPGTSVRIGRSGDRVTVVVERTVSGPTGVLGSST